MSDIVIHDSYVVLSWNWPAVAATVVIVFVVGVGLAWMFSDKRK